MNNIPFFNWNVTDNVMSEDRTNMNPHRRTIHGSDRNNSGGDVTQINLDRFDTPTCPVCHEPLKGDKIQPWIESHIRDHGIIRPVFTGPYKEPEASEWYQSVYMGWLKYSFGVIF
jgi:hypothetical protein